MVKTGPNILSKQASFPKTGSMFNHGDINTTSNLIPFPT